MRVKKLSAKTLVNKIQRLEKHVKKMTFTKTVTVQINGRLKAEQVTKYWGGQQALDKLALLKKI